MAKFARAHVFVYARCLATVVRIDGEIDAANADDLTEAIRGFARLKTPVVLDLSRLCFVSVEGFRALLVVNDELRKARVHCGVVAGTASGRCCASCTTTGWRPPARYRKRFKPSKTSFERDVALSPILPVADSREARSVAAPRLNLGGVKALPELVFRLRAPSHPSVTRRAS